MSNSIESLRQLEDKWHLLMAATYPVGHRYAGQRVYEIDKKYALETNTLRVQIEERKSVEAARPQISPQQLEQLAWLDRCAGARSPDGRRLTDTNFEFAKNVDAMRQAVHAGRELKPAVITATEAEFAKTKITMPEPVQPRELTVKEKGLVAERVLSGLHGLPPPNYEPPAQPIHTRITLEPK